MSRKYLGMLRICTLPLLGSGVEFLMAGAGAIAVAFNLLVSLALYFFSPSFMPVAALEGFS